MLSRMLIQLASLRVRSVVVPLACLALSGCATYIKDEFERARQIQASCTTIQEAIPVHEKKLVETMFNTLALRMLGTCADGNIKCVGPSEIKDGSKTLATSIIDLRRTLKVQGEALVTAQSVRYLATHHEIEALKKEFDSTDDDIRQRLARVDATRISLKETLGGARTRLETNLKGSSQCSQRATCISKLSLVIAKEQDTIMKAGEEFRLALEGVMEIQAQAAKLTARVRDVAVRVDANSTATAKEVKDAGALLDQALAEVVNGAKIQKDRLAIGARTVASLATADVAASSADLLAWKVSSKAAEPLLGLIDRMLSQIDRTIERADSRVYAVMSIGVTVYSPQLQKQFDEIFQKLMTEKKNKEVSTAGTNDLYRNTNLSMKLAFASAACDRLGMGNTAAVSNSSMFAPFLYATLANVKFSVAHPEADALSDDSLGAAARDKLFAEFTRTQAEKTPTADADFSENITNAYVGEVESERAPSVEQQAALCAGTEQAMEERTLTDPALARAMGQAACGQRVLAAVSAGTAISSAAAVTTAVQAVDAHAATEAAKSGQGNGANEWSVAMQAVMASIQKTTGEYEMLCKRIQARLESARCDSGKDGIVIDFGGTFQPGSTKNELLELSLVSVADVLTAYKRNFRVTVHGYASQKLPRCEVSVAKDQRHACAIERNVALADKRASWAASVLKSRMAQYYAANSDSGGLREQLSFDNAFDRRVRVSLAFQE